MIFSLLLGGVCLFRTDTKRKIQRPSLSVFGVVNKTAHALSADEDVVNGVNLGPAALAEKYSEEELAERYSDLLREVMELRAIKSQFAQIQRDNLKLRESLGFLKSTDLSGLVPARVIKRESSTWWNEFWINKGESSGLVLQSPVLTTTLAREGEEPRPALIGKVTALSENTAKVLLLTDERCKVAAKVDRTLESGLLMGSRAQDGTPTLMLRYLSKNTEELLNNPNANVLSSPAGGVVPANFLLGIVKDFKTLEFYGEATVEPAVDFAQLTDVFVMLPTDEAQVIEAAEAADAESAAIPRAAIPVAEPTSEPDPSARIEPEPGTLPEQ